MTPQLRSELYKLRTTRVLPGLLAALVALVTLAMLLHGFGLSVSRLSSAGDQRGVFVDVGLNVGSVFASLLGALSITAEIRSGTIRPTLMVMPRRGVVLAAKAASVLLVGFATGIVATGTAAGGCSSSGSAGSPPPR